MSATDDPSRLPHETEVVVIGGGIAGTMTAFYLAKAGVPVVLCEKGRVACEQSSRNWGWIRKQGRDPRELPAIILALRLWQELVDEIGDEIGWHRGGVTYLAETDERLAELERWLEHARLHQLDSHMLASADVDKLLGQDGRRFKGGLITPSDARAEPRLAISALARRARTLGARLFERCAVRTLDIEAGRVAAVVTERGRIRCKAAVLAGGAWSRLLLRRAGLDLPQLHVKASVQRTSPGPLITESAVGSPKAAFRRRRDGGYTIARSGASTFDITPSALKDAWLYRHALAMEIGGMSFRLGRPFLEALMQGTAWGEDEESPFEQFRVLDPAPDHKLLDDVLRSAQASFPQLEGVTSVERWAGMIDVLPDAIPVMSPVAACPGLIVATGFSGHGFGMGPATGQLVASLAMGREPAVDLRAFAFERFTDGTDIRPYGWG